MRGLFRACYFFCERMQKKRELGIRAFFMFEHRERNTVLIAGTRIIYLRAGLLKLSTTASESDFFCINPASRIRHSSGNNRFGRRRTGWAATRQPNWPTTAKLPQAVDATVLQRFLKVFALVIQLSKQIERNAEPVVYECAFAFTMSLRLWSRRDWESESIGLPRSLTPLDCRNYLFERADRRLCTSIPDFDT